MTVLTSIAAFQGLNGSALLQLERGGLICDPVDGTQLFAQGDVADSIYAIIEGAGEVRIGSGDHRSKNLMVEVVSVGDIFGEIAVIDGRARTAEARVHGRLKMWKISAPTFLSVLESNPRLGSNICRLLASRLRRTYALFQDATFETLESRLARQLIYLGERAGRKTSVGLQLAGRFRQADLADLMGATTRSVIVILNSWRATGLVVYDSAQGRITLADEPRLRRLICADIEL